MTVEYALGTRKFNYGVPCEKLRGRGPYLVSRLVVLTSRIPLAKIHGSVSWDESHKDTEGRRGITGNALIVPPTHEKKLPLSLLQALDLAENVLQKSTRMVVFGFAFNQYDQDILTLLGSSGRNLRAVLLVNQLSCADFQINTARTLWPSASIAFTTPPPEWSIDATIWEKTFC
jgi:hypothetical protein